MAALRFQHRSIEKLDKMQQKEEELAERFASHGLPWDKRIWRTVKQSSLLLLKKDLPGTTHAQCIRGAIGFTYTVHSCTGGLCPASCSLFAELINMARLHLRPIA